MPEFLVTGGAGFIGSNLVHRLAGEGRSVRVLDNFSTGRRGNLAGLGAGVELCEADLRDARAVREAVRGVRCVLHAGALPSVPRSVADPVASNEVNVTGTLNLLVAARDAGVARFVFSSSSSVYGDTPALPKQEDMTPQPRSPYALTKLAGEHYCRIFHALYGLATFSLRYFNVFGPRQDPRSDYAAVIPRFIGASLRNEPCTINGDGRQTRDFTFVEDVVAANLRCCEAPLPAAGGVYNIARGGRTSLLELADLVRRETGSTASPVHREARAGDVRDSQADVTRAREKLDWTSVVTFTEGLRRTIAWFREQPNT